MANGIAVGGFASGLAQGLNQGFTMASAAERDKREAEMFKLEQERKTLELEEAKKEQAYKAELAENMKNLMLNAKGGTVGGEAVDEFGTNLGVVKYADPATAKASGLSFKQGTTVEAKPMDQVELTDKIVDTMMTTGFRHGKVSLEQITQAHKFRKEMEKEGVGDAVRTWLATGDKDATAKQFNKGGKFKMDPSKVDIATEPDPSGMGPANVVVYSVTPDGKRGAKLFDFQEYRFAGISDDAYAKIVSDAKSTNFKENQATKRVGIQEENANKRNSDKIASDRRIAQDKAMRDQYGELYKMYNTQVTGIYKDTFASMDADKRNLIAARTLQRAERLVGQGRMPGAALDEAMQFTFREEGIIKPKN